MHIMTNVHDVTGVTVSEVRELTSCRWQEMAFTIGDGSLYKINVFLADGVAPIEPVVPA